jgi:hypothetical protein
MIKLLNQKYKKDEELVKLSNQNKMKIMLDKKERYNSQKVSQEQNIESLKKQR